MDLGQAVAGASLDMLVAEPAGEPQCPLEALLRPLDIPGGQVDDAEAVEGDRLAGEVVDLPPDPQGAFQLLPCSGMVACPAVGAADVVDDIARAGPVVEVGRDPQRPGVVVERLVEATRPAAEYADIVEVFPSPARSPSFRNSASARSYWAAACS